MRNKSGPSGLHMISDSDQQLMITHLASQAYDTTIIFDDDALLLKERISEILNTKIVYCNRNKRATFNQDVVCVLIKNNSDVEIYLNQDINKLICDLSRTDVTKTTIMGQTIIDTTGTDTTITETIKIDTLHRCEHNAWDCNCDVDVGHEPDVNPAIKNVEIELEATDKKPEQGDIIVPVVCVLNNTVYLKEYISKYTDIDVYLKEYTLISERNEKTEMKSITDITLKYMDCIMADARYICTCVNFSESFIDIIKKINNDVVLIDKKYKKNQYVIMMSNLIHHYVDQTMKIHQSHFFSMDTEINDANDTDSSSDSGTKNQNDNIVDEIKVTSLLQKQSDTLSFDETETQNYDIDNDTYDDNFAKGIKNALAKLSRYSALQKGNMRRYNQRMINPEKIFDLCKKISSVVKSLINQDLEVLEQMYQDSVGSFELYTTIITMSNWIDEMKDGNCIGLNMNIHRGSYRKGRYDVYVLEIPLYVGSSIEMFETLRMNSSNNKKPIDINEHKLMDDGVMGKSNCIIPLYIHNTHWNLSKEYLNPICNLILHDSLKIDQLNAWKLVYCIMIDMGGMMFDKTKRIKSINYFFSLWLTTHVLSKENCYDIGLNKFLTKIREYDEECIDISNVDGDFINKAMIERSNIDPSMIAGQIISTGYMIDCANLNFIKHLIIKTKFDEIRSSIMFDNIYETDEQKINDTTDQNQEKSKKIIPKQLVRVIREKLYVELYRALFFEVFIELFKKKNSGIVLASNLKKTFGIPTDKLIIEMFKTLDRTDVDKRINNLICTTKFNCIDIDSALQNYSDEDDCSAQSDKADARKLAINKHLPVQIQNDDLIDEIELMDQINEINLANQII